jgi:NSS family neurotransmitter:Na+ symporter
MIQCVAIQIGAGTLTQLNNQNKVEPANQRWTSRASFHLAAIGASVGLGSIWRFPYLAGTYGGSTFVVVFIVACFAFATPLLAAELLIGRKGRSSPPLAAGIVAAEVGSSRSWNVIGVVGTLAAFLITSYYTVIAGWVVAYTWKCASGQLTGLSRSAVPEQFRELLSSPVRVGAWHLTFLILVAAISARGIHKGIERVNAIRAPALLILLLILVVYALMTGDVSRGLSFAFAPDWSKFSANLVLAAVGQSFFATGVGMAMMIAYGAYVPSGTSVVGSAITISVSIVAVSLLATLMIFPLVFRYGLNPAQGTDLVFNVLPITFAEMPGGRIIGSAFFLLLVLAALTPTIAALEPVVVWLQQWKKLSRGTAVASASAAVWLFGLGSVLSFNVWEHWRPLAAIPRFATMSFFEVVDFFSANLILPVGALLTCIFVGWRLPMRVIKDGTPEERPIRRWLWIRLLQYICPAAIVAVLIAAMV